MITQNPLHPGDVFDAANEAHAPKSTWLNYGPEETDEWNYVPWYERERRD